MDSLSPSEFIDALGGTAKVATLCHVSPQAVSKWRKTGIPSARLMYLQLVSKGGGSELEEKQPAELQKDNSPHDDRLL